MSDTASPFRGRTTLVFLSIMLVLGPTLRRSPGQGLLQVDECDASKTFHRADSLLLDKKYSEARTELMRLKKCPHLSQIEEFNLGWLLGRARDFSAAIEIFRSVDPNVPDMETHRYAIALSEFQLHDYRGVISTLGDLQTQGTLDSRSAELLGVAYSKEGKYPEAYSTLSENARHHPEDPLSYLDLVALLADTGDFTRALNVANLAIASFPGNPEARIKRGSIEMFQGEFEKAHDDFRQAIQEAPNDPTPRFFEALADYKLQKFFLAREELNAAIDYGIVDSDLHYVLAECLIRIEPTAPGNAVAELNKAIEINPKSVSPRILRGELLLDMGKPQQALEDLLLATQLQVGPQRDTRNAIYLLARAYRALGQEKQAKELFAKVRTQLRSDKETDLDRLGNSRMKDLLDH